MLFAGCFSPPTRDQKEDERMAASTAELSPQPRGSIDAAKAAPGDPPAPGLDEDVRRLSAERPLERMQAENRLRAAGPAGALAAARFLSADAAPSALVEAVVFLEDVDLTPMEHDQREDVRALLANALSHESALVRAHAARALQIQGPGAQRTAFLQAIADPERRVRWAVVRRFGDAPEELDAIQRQILISHLQVRPRASFDAQDVNRDGSLSRAEFTGTDALWRIINTDGDDAISLEEWSAPAPSGVRADVIELLLRMHAKLTPGLEPAGYNPYAPANEQLNAAERWRTWSENLPK